MGLFDPQGISSSPNTQSVVTSGINSWAQPYVFNYLNQGNALLNQGPTAMQQSVWDQAANMQTPGQFGQGSSLLNQAGQGQLGTTNQALGYGAAGANYGFNAGQNYANQATSPEAMGAYMNPYIQQALAPQLALLNQQQALAGQGIAAKAVGQGAFGGNRATLAQGLNAQNYDLARQQAIGQGYNQAFNQAQQAQQFGANLGLQGAMQGAGLGLQGVQGAQQGYTGATQAGVGLGNIGAQQSQADVARLGLQNQIANQQYNLPFQRLNFMQGLMSGLPVSSTTTQGYQAGQNPWLQGIGAAGTVAQYAPNILKAGQSAWNFVKGAGDNGVDNITTDQWMSGDFAEGGEVKRFAEGGIASINRRVMNDPTAYSEQTVNRGAQNNILGGVTKLLALDTIAKQKQALQAQQAMQTPPQVPIAQQLAQQAAMGIDSAESNLPQQYAGGGIIAFDDGGSVFERMKERMRKATESATDIPSIPSTLFGIPLWGAANKEELAQTRLAPTPTDAKPDELGRYKAGTDSGIVIHDNAPRSAGIGGGGAAAPVMAAPAYRPADTSGIDALRAKYEDMIRGGEDFKQAEKQTETNALRNLFLNMMNPERGASFVAGLGGAGQKAQAGLEKAQEELQTRKDAQIAKLVSLGLKGEDLKNAAKKVGIDEAELQAKIPYLAAHANYYNAAARTAGQKGAGSAGLGSVPFGEFNKLRTEYEGYYASPQAVLMSPFARFLDKDTRDALKTKPGSPSYERGMAKAREIGEAHKRSIMQEGMQYSSKQRVASQ